MLLVYYKVRPGDSLQSVASDHQISVVILAAANSLPPDAVDLPTVLRIPAPVADAAREPVPRPRGTRSAAGSGEAETAPGLSASSSPICRITGAQDAVYLTIELSSGAHQVEALIARLAARRAKVTWFVTGEWAAHYPGIARRLVVAGHQVESHGHRHEALRGRAARIVRADLTSAAQSIRRSTGATPRLLRPPFGEWDQALLRLADAARLRVVTWTVDSLDWQGIDVTASVRRVLAVTPLDGAIISLHGGADSLPAVLADLLIELERRGLRSEVLGSATSP